MSEKCLKRAHVWIFFLILVKSLEIQDCILSKNRKSLEIRSPLWGRANFFWNSPIRCMTHALSAGKKCRNLYYLCSIVKKQTLTGRFLITSLKSNKGVKRWSNLHCQCGIAEYHVQWTFLTIPLIWYSKGKVFCVTRVLQVTLVLAMEGSRAINDWSWGGIQHNDSNKSRQF